MGRILVLEGAETHKVKRILVNPGGRLSLQYPHHRGEVLIIVSGARTIIINDEFKNYKAGKVAQIPLAMHHRIESTTNDSVIFIEVQFGAYFVEGYIIRVEDDHNRA